eukprot:jgi/Mesvir1/10425/Mv12689-RA.1
MSCNLRIGNFMLPFVLAAALAMILLDFVLEEGIGARNAEGRLVITSDILREVGGLSGMTPDHATSEDNIPARLKRRADRMRKAAQSSPGLVQDMLFKDSLADQRDVINQNTNTRNDRKSLTKKNGIPVSHQIVHVDVPAVPDADETIAAGGEADLQSTSTPSNALEEDVNLPDAAVDDPRKQIDARPNVELSAARPGGSLLTAWQRVYPSLPAVPQNLAEQGWDATRPASKPRPRIYFYDLGERFSQPCSWDFQCKYLVPQLRASPYATQDPDEADYFWLPHPIPLEPDIIDDMLHTVQHNWPYWNRSMEAVGERGARHIMVLPCEAGPGSCSFSNQQRWLGGMPPEFSPLSTTRGLIFLMLNGMMDGPKPGVPTNRESCRVCFQRGKDIMLPTPHHHVCGPLCGYKLDVLRSMSPWNEALSTGPPQPWWQIDDAQPSMARLLSADPHPRAQRASSPLVANPGTLPVRGETLLFFGGSIHPKAADRSRTALLAHHTNTSGFLVHNSHHEHGSKARLEYAREMLRATFCYVPLGKFGGDPDRYLPAILFGCIPVMAGSRQDAPMVEPLEEHPALDWRKFSVHVTVEEIPQLESILRSYTPRQLDAMRSELARVWPRFLYTSLHGSYLGEDGSRDAVDALMAILRRRLALAGAGAAAAA